MIDPKTGEDILTREEIAKLREKNAAILAELGPAPAYWMDEPDEETEGTRIAREGRKVANKFTDEEREYHSAEAMKIIKASPK